MSTTPVTTPKTQSELQRQMGVLRYAQERRCQYQRTRLPDRPHHKAQLLVGLHQDQGPRKPMLVRLAKSRTPGHARERWRRIVTEKDRRLLRIQRPGIVVPRSRYLL